MPRQPELNVMQEVIEHRLRQVGVALDISARILREIACELRQPESLRLGIRQEGLLRFVSGALRELRTAVDEVADCDLHASVGDPVVIARIESSLPNCFEILTRSKTSPSRPTSIMLPRQSIVQFLRTLSTSTRPPVELAAVRVPIAAHTLPPHWKLRADRVIYLPIDGTGLLGFGDAETIERLLESDPGNPAEFAQVQHDLLIQQARWLGRWQYPSQCHLLPGELLSVLQARRVAA